MVIRKSLNRLFHHDNDNNHETHDTSPATSSKQIWYSITGQSLAVGYQGWVPPNLPAASNAYKLQSPNPRICEEFRDNPNDSSLTLAPLTEPIRPLRVGAHQYPNNVEGKTCHHSMALQIARVDDLSRRRRGGGAGEAAGKVVTTHSIVGRSGAPMSDICKRGTGNAYAASLYETHALKRLAANPRPSPSGQRLSPARLHVGAIILTHGETDAMSGNATYADQVIALQQHYSHDLQKITGQTTDIPIIQSQQHTSPPCPGDAGGYGSVIQAQWSTQAQTGFHKIICAGPKYQYGYHPDALHLLGPGYNRLGEKYGQVFYQTVIEGRTFVPLSPRGAGMVGPAAVRVEFNVPVPPMNWDPFLPAVHAGQGHPWKDKRGFEVRDRHGRMIPIRGVQIQNDGISIVLWLGMQAEGPLALGYAMTQDKDGMLGGCAEGRMGHLRDSDPMVGAGAEVMECDVQHGSCEMKFVHGRGERAVWDFVADVNVVAGWEERGLVNWKPEDENAITRIVEHTATLGRPWPGQSGRRKLLVWHNQRNYCVSFVIGVR